MGRAAGRRISHRGLEARAPRASRGESIFAGWKPALPGHGADVGDWLCRSSIWSVVDKIDKIDQVDQIDQANRIRVGRARRDAAPPIAGWKPALPGSAALYPLASQKAEPPCSLPPSKIQFPMAAFGGVVICQ